MSYHLDRKNKIKKFQKIAMALFLFFILFYFRGPIFYGVGNVVNFLLKPVILIGNKIGFNLDQTSLSLKSKKSLLLENETLKNELIEKNLAITNANFLISENEKLKEVLGRKKSQMNLVLGAILVRPNQSVYDTLLIDIGEDHGITQGSMVFALGNTPIGKISEVYKNSSKVILFSTPKENTDVIVSGPDVAMQIVGRGGGNFEMILPRDFEIKKGMTVQLPGIDSFFLAQVVTIISDPRDAYQKALLTSPVNIQHLKFVEVEK